MAIARFSLAVDRRFQRQDAQGEQANADFISCVAFGKQGELVEKYFHKGMKMVLTGRIQTGSYTNKEGSKVYTTDVVAEEIEFAESKNAQGGGSNEGYTRNPAPADDGFMNIPTDGIESEIPFN